jgi:hypothetical protein
VSHLNSLHNNNAGSDFQIIAVSKVGWSGCTNGSQIWSTAQSWGSQYGIAEASSVPAYYFPGGSLSFGTCWAFDKTGKLLWTGSSSQVTDTMIQNWISQSGSGGGGGGGGGGGTNPPPPPPPPSSPPVAEAGPVQGVEYGINVTLDGSGSFDPEGTNLQFSWNQVSGTTVTLNGAGTANPTFMSPGVDDVLKFNLTVADGDGLLDSDTVTIYVNSAGAIPQTGGGNAGGGCTAQHNTHLALLTLFLVAAGALYRRRRTRRAF